MPSNSSPYDYTPSVPAAVVFAVLYTIAAAITTFQYFYHRCWFWLPFVIGSLMEATGYIARIVSAKNPEERNPFIIQFIMIFLAPALLAASCYMAMGRVVLHVTPVEYQTIKSLWVKARWMTPVFVTFDVIAFFIQVIGGVSATSDSISTQKRGYNIAKIGLVVQLFAFGFFIVISFRFHIFSKKFRDSWPDSRWVNFLWGINISAVLIFIRSVYRLVEFASGVDSYLQVHEWGSIVFEAVMILPVFVIFNIMHPANYLNNISWKQNKVVEVNHRRLHSDGTELMEQGSGTPRK